MRKSILVAASVLALGIGGVGVGHATPGPSFSSGQTTQWMAGYGIPATPAQMARVTKELGPYGQRYEVLATPTQVAGVTKELGPHGQVASAQQRVQNGTAVRYAQIGTTRELEFPGG
jgi:hypothetical protein